MSKWRAHKLQIQKQNIIIYQSASGQPTSGLNLEMSKLFCALVSNDSSRMLVARTRCGLVLCVRLRSRAFVFVLYVLFFVYWMGDGWIKGAVRGLAG